MPTITFDEEEKGWKCIFLGLLSPYSNKYQSYVKTALKKAKEEQKKDHTQQEEYQNIKRTLTNNEVLPSYE